MTSDDIIKKHMTEDGLDFNGVFTELQSITEGDQIHVSAYLQVLEQHQMYGLMFLSELVLDMLEAAEALPQGKATELQNLHQIFRLDKARRIHDMLNPQLPLAEVEGTPV